MSETEDIQALRERVRLLEAVVDNFPGGLLLFDKNLRLVFCNAYQMEMLEYPDSLFAAGNPTIEEIFRFNAERGEYGPGDVETIVSMRMELVRKRCAHVFERTRPNGTVLEIRGRPLSEGGFVTTYLDVTAQREGQKMLAHYARHDSLTGLPNRDSMNERLKLLLAEMNRDRNFAVLYVDLDDFKPVNDTHGHAVGDTTLKAAAQVMANVVRATDMVARIGGDEFVVLQPDIQNELDCIALANRIISEVSKPRFINDLSITIGASIGIAVGPWHGSTAEELLSAADKALYTSKQRGGSMAQFADSPSPSRATSRGNAKSLRKELTLIRAY